MLFIMANDPNRDLLPVKEEYTGKTGKGLNDRIDHQLMFKHSRCELGDKVLNLLDEKAQLKKIVYSQEETTKKLQTKLQRLTAERKSKQKILESSADNEELNLRIIELEHENYVLKDKNTVLRQQLANHTRHISAHHSQRLSYIPSFMSVRQSAPPQNEVVYDSSNNNAILETQTRDADLHIKQLNEEIKALHIKIDYLQQNVEKNSLSNRKTKVTENIELIRLQRSLKQQAIQIETLQAQVRTSENNQKLLKEELIRAHDENDEAMNMITMKQNEILMLCTQLDKKNLNRFEEEELRERINDLIKERNVLKERSDFLIKTIGNKTGEDRRIRNLKKSLAEEKLKKEELENKLKEMEMVLKNLQNSNQCSANENKCVCESSLHANNKSEKVLSTVKKVANGDRLYSFSEVDECSVVHRVNSFENPVQQLEQLTEDDRESRSSVNINGLASAFDIYAGEFSAPAVKDCEVFDDETVESKASTEKLKMKRELQYLRDMLRNQTALCSAQQTEIGRLNYELKLNEEKYNSTLQRLESYLMVLEKSQQKISEKHDEAVKNVTSVEDKKMRKESRLSPGIGDAQCQTINDQQSVNGRQLKSVEQKKNSGDKSTASSVSGLLNSESYTIESLPDHENDRLRKTNEFGLKMRFIEQVFLESSDEEDGNEEKTEKVTLIKKLETLKNEPADTEIKKEKISEPLAQTVTNRNNTSPYLSKSEQRKKFSSEDLLPKIPTDTDNKETEKKLNPPEEDKFTKNRLSRAFSHTKEDNIQIGIIWLQVDLECSVWDDDEIQLLFVDFSFLEIKGEETETPNSLQKPKSSEEKCEFNFYKSIEMTENKKKQLDLCLKKPDLDLIVFKVVSEPDKFQEDLECEDIGVAVVTVRQFLNNVNNGTFIISVKNMRNFKEEIGKLAVSVSSTPGSFNFKH